VKLDKMPSSEDLEILKELEDIKPLLSVPDYSLYWMVAVCIVGILATGIVLWYLLRALRRRSKNRARKKRLRELELLDYADSKKVAYIFSRYGREFVQEGISMSMFETLEKKLEPYKYRKNVPKIDATLQEEIRNFIGVLRV
jgi:hypothetical protein